MKTPPVSEGTTGATGRFGPDGRDRRRRRRVKMTMPVHISGGIGSTDPFEDLAKTIDASRDGLLVATARGIYWPGQILEVRFGYGTELTAAGSGQSARVIRNTLQPDHLSYAVALEFQKVEAIKAQGLQLSTRIPKNGVVLFVESDPRIASLTRNLLQEDGYQVVHASSGTEALEILLTATPDVLLAGIEGDEVNGRDLCTIVKKSSRLQHIPVILLTRSGHPSDYSACHQVGAVLCMAMPCPPNKLQHAVRLVAPPRSSDRSYSELRKIPRYPFAAMTEMTDPDGVRLSARVAEISRRGCYVDTLNTLPLGTIRQMQIFRDSGVFVTKGKIIYVHQGIGMGVIFQSPSSDQMKVLDFWLAGFEADTLPLDEETDLIESSTDLKRISI
jgi:CheY-like chemotaxis protein